MRTPGSGNIYKRRWKTKNGQIKISKEWHIWYVDANGKTNYQKGYTDKLATEELLRQIKKDIAYQLEGIGIPNKQAFNISISKHVDAFVSDKKLEGNSFEEIKRKKTRINKFINTLKIKTFKDINEGTVKEFILIQHDELSKKTRNKYKALLKQFSSWISKQCGWQDPLADLKLEKGEDETAVRRFALSEKQLAKLIKAAQERGTNNYIKNHQKANKNTLRQISAKGLERALIYQIGALAGLRANEIRTLTWDCLDLENPIPTYTIKPKNAKSKRRDTVPINKKLAKSLSMWKEFVANQLKRTVSGNDLVVHMPRHLCDEQFYKDCEYANIQTRNYKGEKLDFYAATRHTFCTLLAQKERNPHILMKLMRHRDLQMTMKYTHLEVEILSSGAEKMPDFEILEFGSCQLYANSGMHSYAKLDKE